MRGGARSARWGGRFSGWSPGPAGAVRFCSVFCPRWLHMVLSPSPLCYEMLPKARWSHPGLTECLSEVPSAFRININPHDYVYATKKVWGFVVAWASRHLFSYEFWCPAQAGQCTCHAVAWLHTCDTAGMESFWHAVSPPQPLPELLYPEASCIHCWCVFCLFKMW